MNNIIHKYIYIIARMFGLISGLTLIAIVVLTTIHVLSVLIDRTLYHLAGIVGIEEIVALLSGVAFFTAIPYGQSQSVHVKVDFIKWHNSISSLSNRLSLILFVVLYLALSVAMFFGMKEALGDNATSSVLSIPHWPFYLPAVISTFVAAIVAMSQIKKNG